MNWLDVFCFTSVARSGNFSSTARELMITQQAVSRHIRSLEDELGFALFLRGTQSVTLSAAGKAMMEYFARRDELLDSFHRRDPQPEVPRRLRIACSSWLGCPGRMQKALSAFGAAHPEIEILRYDVTVSELKDALAMEEIDLAILTRCAAAACVAHWKQQPLGEEPLYLLTDAAHGLPAASCPQLSDRLGETEDAPARRRVRLLCEKLHMAPDRIDIFPDLDSVIINIPLRHGAAFCTGRKELAEHPDYRLWPTALTVTAVLCTPPGRNNSTADELLRLFSEQEAQP